MQESKNEKFRRLAKTRVEMVREGLRKVGNLSSTTNYDYSEEDVEKVFEFIDERVKEAKKMFSTEQTAAPTLEFSDSEGRSDED